MRIFAGLDIDPEIRRRASLFMEELRAHAPQAKWVRPELLHVTLKFMGEKPPETVEQIREALTGIEAPSFELSFRGCGCFPSARTPRVFWIAIQESTALVRLAQQVDEAVSGFGLEREKSYTPHITLARARVAERRKQSASRSLRPRSDSDGSLERLAERVATLSEPEFGTMIAREYFLFESKLSPAGPQYRKLARFELG